MRANELRLDNWVLENSKPVKVSVENAIRLYRKIQSIQPIPLTPEILEKCGFWKYKKTKEDNQIYRISWDEGYVNIEQIIDFYLQSSDYIVHIKTVHQLQNLFYILTNAELEIKL